MRRIILSLGMLVWATTLGATPQKDLADTLRLGEMVEIVREEGVLHGEELANGMFATGSNPRWSRQVSEIYNAARLEKLVRSEFIAALDGQDVAPLLAFFSTETGKRVLSLELETRRAMIDSDIEQAARQSFLSEDASSADRRAQLMRFIEVNDLLELNVAGALNSLLKFYSGMADGGALQVSESEILRDVWAQEPETRVESREWLFGYALLAYSTLSDPELDDYIDVTASQAGQAMNKALFAGFNRMYDEVSYALGLAMAEQMAGSDL